MLPTPRNRATRNQPTEYVLGVANFAIFGGQHVPLHTTASRALDASSSVTAVRWLSPSATNVLCDGFYVALHITAVRWL